MDRLLDSTRSFESRDPRWHSAVEIVESVSEVVELVRDYLATLPPDRYTHLPESCRSLRVKAEDDIEYWTLRLSQRHEPGAGTDPEVAQDLFNHLLHASLRISRIRRNLVNELH
jgi:hypothetical protein